MFTRFSIFFKNAEEPLDTGTSIFLGASLLCFAVRVIVYLSISVRHRFLRDNTKSKILGDVLVPGPGR